MCTESALEDGINSRECGKVFMDVGGKMGMKFVCLIKSATGPVQVLAYASLRQVGIFANATARRIEHNKKKC